MYMLIVNVPESHVEIVKEAIFNAGAGRMGNYSHCSSQTLVEGQFKPLSGSQPFIGATDVLEKVKEYEVKTICDTASIKAVVAALKQAHPYEVPSYQVIKLESNE